MKHGFLNSFRRIIILLLIAILPILVNSSCKVLRPDSKSKAEKKQKKADKEAMVEFENARKAHLKNQSKETRKMMKSTKKKAGKYNLFKKRKGKSPNTCS